MAQARITDYYAVLAVPPNADLTGIQNAYARLSDEIARLMGEDDTIQEGILRLNEAYHVLSNPETRSKYDAFYFSGERAIEQRKAQAAARKRNMAGRAIVGVLGLFVTAQIVAIVYLSRDQVSDFAATVLGGLFPGSAG